MIVTTVRLLFTSLMMMCYSSALECSQQDQTEIEIKNLQGEEARPYLEKLSDFYNVFYQDPPYRYHATKADWDGYVASYVNNPSAVISLALKHDVIIGAAMGTPLKDASEKYQAAFAQRPPDLNSLFYLGELAIKPRYAHLGIGTSVYEEFERLVKQKKLYSGICLWQLSSECAAPAGQFWRKMGFEYFPEINFEEMWRENANPNAPMVAHAMKCWKKKLA